MKLFLDTANLADIEEALQGGFIRGITTNPSLLAKEPKGDYIKHVEKIADLAREHGGTASLSIEVFTDDPKGMVAQAKEFSHAIKYKYLAVKIPISYKGGNYLNVIRELAKDGILINCTACMTPLQLTSAAAAGAKYVSLFYNRLKDGSTETQYETDRQKLLTDGIIEKEDYDPDKVIRETRALLADYPDSEIIVGSIRNPVDVKRAGLAGGHIVTASLKILKSALMHFKTDDSVARFMKDFEAWTK